MPRGKAFIAADAAESRRPSAAVAVDDPTVVDAYGPAIPGEHKWLGAAVAEDGAIYGVPSHNRRVVRVVPGTGEVTELGSDDVLSTRKYKYREASGRARGRSWASPRGRTPCSRSRRRRGK